MYIVVILLIDNASNIFFIKSSILNHRKEVLCFYNWHSWISILSDRSRKRPNFHLWES